MYTHTHYACIKHFLFSPEDMFLLILERKGGAERHKHTHRCEGETSVSCLLHKPQPSIELVT